MPSRNGIHVFSIDELMRYLRAGLQRQEGPFQARDNTGADIRHIQAAQNGGLHCTKWDNACARRPMVDKKCVKDGRRVGISSNNEHPFTVPIVDEEGSDSLGSSDDLGCLQVSEEPSRYGFCREWYGRGSHTARNGTPSPPLPPQYFPIIEGSDPQQLTIAPMSVEWTIQSDVQEAQEVVALQAGNIDARFNSRQCENASESYREFRYLHGSFSNRCHTPPSINHQVDSWMRICMTQLLTIQSLLQLLCT